ncbi:MAG: hypothetical protein AB8B71_02830 [Paracoccaceae bacterium]
MSSNLFFRVRKNGVAVFRALKDIETHRLDLRQIAVVKEDTGDMKLKDQIELSESERETINAWIKARQSSDTNQAREISDQLNMAAQWIQADASDAEIAEAEARILMSIHDLRSTLVRRLAKIARKSS